MNQQHEINILKNVMEKAEGISERLLKWAEAAITEIKKEISDDLDKTADEVFGAQEKEPVPASDPTPTPEPTAEPQPTPAPTPEPTPAPTEQPSPDAAQGSQDTAASPAHASAAPDEAAPSSQGSDG